MQFGCRPSGFTVTHGICFSIFWILKKFIALISRFQWSNLSSKLTFKIIYFLLAELVEMAHTWKSNNNPLKLVHSKHEGVGLAIDKLTASDGQRKSEALINRCCMSHFLFQQ